MAAKQQGCGGAAAQAASKATEVEQQSCGSMRLSSRQRSRSVAQCDSRWGRRRRCLVFLAEEPAAREARVGDEAGNEEGGGLREATCAAERKTSGR
uniref:Uncharacterized protein n=1 Tax=Leersia perrieri TaxID=77586 RepID=A0A0D9VV78_9ORYZ